MHVLLTGATGFVGSHILPRLIADGHNVHVLLRDIKNLPRTDRVTAFCGDVTTNAGIDEAVAGCDAVVHLVGIIVEVGDATFERVHHIGTQNVVRAAKRAGVKRFVQMSALGVRENGVSEYQRSKWRGEQEVRASGINYVILCPSLIFGPRDGFVTQMLDVMRKSPLVRPIPGTGCYTFRPIYVKDVVECFAQALTNDRVTNKTIELGGAEELTLENVLAQIADCAGIRKPAVHVPMPVMYANAALMGKVLRRPPVTTDQLRMLEEGSTCDIRPMIEAFSFHPIGFRQGLERYFCGKQ